MSANVDILSNMKLDTGNSIPADKSYILKLELTNGTSQLVQITEEQANNLGIKFNDAKPNEHVESSPMDDPLPCNELLPVKDEPQENNFVYKIVKPEDLNLKPVLAPHLPRGRPRKRPAVVAQPPQPPKLIKQVRTRSGRITKPPRHIEQDFQEIIITDDGDLKTIEFEPLSTNETASTTPLLHLRYHSKKRNIAARYRCPTCKKAYLGKMKMLSHLLKYPDHGPLPSYCKAKHNSTWDFLILTTQKYKEGTKALRFCEELSVVLQNARILSKRLLKPVGNGDAGYLVSDELAMVFGILPGRYGFDEEELMKDVNLYNFLDHAESKNAESVPKEQKFKKKIAKKDKASKVDKAQGNVSKNEVVGVNAEFIDDKINGQYDLQNTPIDINSQKKPKLEFLSSNEHNLSLNDLVPLKSNFVNAQQSNLLPMKNGNSLALVKYEVNGHNVHYPNLNNELIHAFDSNTNLNGLDVNYPLTMDVDKLAVTDKQLLNMKTLQNELLSNDVELMLENVDTGQVSGILDTSSNSDDIMNVDQFVNERFKKLTEPDIEIQNTALHLELPPLDIFQFHTS